MARRSAISVHVDDAGKLTADLGALPKDARKRAAIAVKAALRGVVVGAVEGDLTEDQWAAAWDPEIARRVKDVEAGRAKLVPLDRALRQIRGVARGPR